MGPLKQKKYKLPKTLLDMKFMKKTKEKEEQRREDEDRQAMFSNEITEEMLDGQKIIEEQSLVTLLALREGRFSYRGINPEIERLMENEEAAKLEAEEKAKQESEEKCVLDDDMAERMGRLSKSIGLKYLSKRQRSEDNPYKKVAPGVKPDPDDSPSKKFKFLKPPSE